MKYDGNAVVDGLFEGSEIGNDRVKCVVAKMLTQLRQVLLLVRAPLLESRRDKAEQLQRPIVCLLNVFKGRHHVLCSECSPLSGFQRDHQEVGCTKCGVRNERNIGGAVKQNVVVELTHFIQRIDE